MLSALAGRTNHRGEYGVHVLIRVSGDSSFPPVARLYAFWSFEAYWGLWGCPYYFPFADYDLRLATWVPDVFCHIAGKPGDSELVVAPSRPSRPPAISQAAAVPALRSDSLPPCGHPIDPTLRDTIRAALARIAASGDPLSGAATTTLRHLSTPQASALVDGPCRG